MRVLVLTTTFPRWKNDTTPAFVYELSKRIKEEFEIVVLAPHCEGAKRFEIMEGLNVYRFPYFYPAKYQRLAYGGGILPNLKRSHLAKIQVPLLFLSELFYAFKIIREKKIDVIHSHWIIPNGLIGAICKKIQKKKHLLTLHAAGLFALERLPLKKKIANFVVEHCDKITVVSSYIHERLLNLIQPKILDNIKNKTEIIPMGVNTSLFRLNTNKNELKIKYSIKSKSVLLFTGRLAEKKGLAYLIKAMPEVLSKSSNTELIICGDGPLKKEMEQLVKEIDLEKFVRSTGYVTNKEKIDYLSLSDILIVPSIVAQSGDTEGLPVVILEGLAAGKPIIASDVSGVKDVIKDGWNGFLVEQRNPEQIAEKVLELLNEEELRVRFSKNALETAKKYDWEVIGGEYEKIIKILLNYR